MQEESEELRALQSHIAAAETRLGQRLQLQERSAAAAAARQDSISFDRALHEQRSHVRSWPADPVPLTYRHLDTMHKHCQLCPSVRDNGQWLCIHQTLCSYVEGCTPALAMCMARPACRLLVTGIAEIRAAQASDSTEQQACPR